MELSEMKSLLKKIVLSSLVLWFIKLIALLLGYDQRIFKSKFFNKKKDGWIWLIKSFWFQRLLGFNRLKRYPMHPSCSVNSFHNLDIHIDSINNLMSPGCYFQNFSAKILIGRDVYIAPNVEIITANHDPLKPSRHLKGKEVIIQDECWIGMNSVILPGVILGPNTIVGAGSVVTKSFPAGGVLLTGTPATIKKKLFTDDSELSD
jgi:acetyltransferase-like isoleucine patch superfamily enzyme